MGKESRRRQPQSTIQAPRTPKATVYLMSNLVKALLFSGMGLYVLVLGFAMTQSMDKLFPKFTNLIQPVPLLFLVEYGLCIGFARLLIDVVTSKETCREEIVLLIAFSYLYPLSLVTFWGNSYILSVCLNLILLVVFSGWMLMLEKQKLQSLPVSLLYGWTLAKTALILSSFTQDNNLIVLILALLCVALIMKYWQHNEPAFLCIFVLIVGGLAARYHETYDQWMEVRGLFWDSEATNDLDIPDF